VPGEPLNEMVELVPGFYGKLPVRGDFLSRRLPGEFVSAWDVWLQHAINTSREQLGDQWLEIYLTSPIWRFVLNGGLCGRNRWAGLMMPSVDSVGRYFPLTVAVQIPQSIQLAVVLGTASKWFDEVGNLVLSALESDLDVEEFDNALRQLDFPNQRIAGSVANNDKNNSGYGKASFHITLHDTEEISLGLNRLSCKVLDAFMPSYSLWNSVASKGMNAELIACEGLPAIETYVALLRGDWVEASENNVSNTASNLNDSPDFESTLEPFQSLKLFDDVQVPIQPMHRDESVVDQDPVRWISTACTNVGTQRESNQDAYVVNDSIGFWLVADGMGGHQAGQRASQMIADRMREFELADELADAAEQVDAQLNMINRDLNLLAEKEYSGQVIGSTVVVLIGRKHKCTFLWAGDSRLYRYRDHGLMQMTLDHSSLGVESDSEVLLQDTIDSELSTNVITRAVGAETKLWLDIESRGVQNGDLYLLCSDGLIKEIGPVDIEAILAQQDCSDRAKALVDLALERGCRDNVTAVVVEAEELSA